VGVGWKAFLQMEGRKNCTAQGQSLDEVTAHT
jgi:hypothetical protein